MHFGGFFSTSLSNYLWQHLVLEVNFANNLSKKRHAFWTLTNGKSWHFYQFWRSFRAFFLVACSPDRIVRAACRVRVDFEQEPICLVAIVEAGGALFQSLHELRPHMAHNEGDQRQHNNERGSDRLVFGRCPSWAFPKHAA